MLSFASRLCVLGKGGLERRLVADPRFISAFFQGSVRYWLNCIRSGELGKVWGLFFMGILSGHPFCEVCCHNLFWWFYLVASKFGAFCNCFHRLCMFASFLLTCYSLILSCAFVLNFAHFLDFQPFRIFVRPFEFDRSGIMVFTHRSALVERVSLRSAPVCASFGFETVLSTVWVFTWILKFISPFSITTYVVISCWCWLKT